MDLLRTVQDIFWSVFSCEEAMDLERGGDNFLFIEGTMPCKVNRLFAVLKEGAR